MRLANFLFVLILFAGLRFPAHAAEDVLLPLSFENLSGRSENQWISESFSAIFADLLDTPGIVVLSTDERAFAYERAGLRTNDVLTRATELRLAQLAQANLLLVGNYDVSGEGRNATVAITAWMIDVQEGRKKPFNFSGPLTDLQTLQGLLAWNILYERDPALPYSQEQFKRRAKMIPPRAYEFYVKAMQTPDEKSREIFLKRAIKEYNEAESVGHYARAIFQLGLLKFRQRSYAEATSNFNELIKDDPHYLESLFFAGLAAQNLGQTGNATDIYEKLATAVPLVEVLNNAGVLQIAKGDYNRAIYHLQRAAASAQQDAMVRFNFGYALWQNKNYASAANEFKAVVTANPKDGEAQFFLAKSAAQVDRKIDAEMADQEARKLLVDSQKNYAKWSVAPEKIPLLIRLKNDFNRVNFYKLNRRQATATNLPPTQVRLALQSLERAKQFFTEKNDSDALTELQKALTNDPTLAEAHYLRGRVMQQKNDSEAALSAYAAAVYWNPRLTAAHIALGQIYLARGDRSRALSHSKSALEIDAQDREAIALKRQIESGR